MKKLGKKAIIGICAGGVLLVAAVAVILIMVLRVNPAEAQIGFEPVIRELQSHALPLGYCALLIASICIYHTHAPSGLYQKVHVPSSIC